jgi:hypothetical protein
MGTGLPAHIRLRSTGGNSLPRRRHSQSISKPTTRIRHRFRAPRGESTGEPRRDHDLRPVRPSRYVPSRTRKLRTPRSSPAGTVADGAAPLRRAKPPRTLLRCRGSYSQVCRDIVHVWPVVGRPAGVEGELTPRSATSATVLPQLPGPDRRPRTDGAVLITTHADFGGPSIDRPGPTVRCAYSAPFTRRAPPCGGPP